MKCSNCNDTRIEIIPQGQFAVAQRCSRCVTVCPKCEDTGYIFKKDELGREHAEACQCKDIDHRITLYNAARIPGQFYDATFSNFNISGHASLRAALDTARFSLKNYQKGNWKGLLFMGGVGIGKTRLVCTMLRSYTLEYGIPSLFKEFSSLLSEIKTGYDQGLSEVRLLETINQTEILVVDELGKGRKSDWEINILDTIVSSRYNMRKTTIFTTNYTESKATSYPEPQSFRNSKDGMEEPEIRETLKQRVYPRIYSRLKEMCDFIEMKGADFRMPNNGFTA